ncbi:MAG: hypothetical protein HQ474_08290 [Flammeovirgaceae bacterium]|nr:hypothetical protein [Flammeovirgaceae bacterium]
MRKNNFLINNNMYRSVFIFLVSFLFCQSKCIAQEPIKCQFGIYAKTLRINQAEETFETFFYWWLRVDSIQPNIDYSFVKEFEFINADLEMFEFDAADSSNGYYYVSGRCKAIIPYKSDYHKFPFDIQNLKISIENKVANSKSLVYIPDDATTPFNNINDENVEILNGDQYSISSLQAVESSYIYTTNFGDRKIEGNEKYSRLEFHIGVERDPTGMIQKISLPLIIVLILAYLVFYIPDHEIQTASGLTVTALLAAIAFQWTINDTLPKVSYLTTIDRIFFLIYAYIFYAMAQIIVTFNLSNKSEYYKNISNKIEIHSRYLFPLTFGVLLFLIAH